MSTSTFPRQVGSIGFSLIELLAVVAILGLLMAMLLPIIALVRDQATRIVCASNMRGAGVAFLAFATDHRGQLPVFASDGWEPHCIGANYYSPWYQSSLPVQIAPYLSGGDLKIFNCPTFGNRISTIDQAFTGSFPGDPGYGTYSYLWGRHLPAAPNALRRPTRLSGSLQNDDRSRVESRPWVIIQDNLNDLPDWSLQQFNHGRPGYEFHNTAGEADFEAYLQHDGNVHSLLATTGANLMYNDLHVEWRRMSTLTPVQALFAGYNNKFYTEP